MVDWRDPDKAAAEVAGNHRKFESFCWHDRPEDDGDWFLTYTNHRDSGLLDEVNAEAIAEEMRPFLEAEDADVVPQHHGHWGVGWVDGYAIRVRKRGELTPAFLRWCELQERLKDYPVLDEEALCRAEHEATLDNIKEEGRQLVIDDAPDDWPSRCFDWFWDNDQAAVECMDGGGGYPSEDEMRACLFALDLLSPAEYYSLRVEKDILWGEEDKGKFLSLEDAKEAWYGHVYQNLGQCGGGIYMDDERIYP